MRSLTELEPPTYPQKLQPGDTVAVISPAGSFWERPDPLERRQAATALLNAWGLTVKFGENASQPDDATANSVAARIDDLEAAFADPDVKAIFASTGGHSTIDLLDPDIPHPLDWDIIRNNPTLFCGFSDHTVLHTAIGAMANQVTYYGPPFRGLTARTDQEYMLGSLKTALFERGWRHLRPSQEWAYGPAKPQLTGDYVVIQEGTAEGRVVGGNLGSFYLTQGTPYFTGYPSNTILAVESDNETDEPALEFNRTLRSMFYQNGHEHIRGLLIGRFMPPTETKGTITIEDARDIVSQIGRCAGIPVIAGVDFGHTDPKAVLPMWGNARMSAAGDNYAIEIEI